MEVFGIRNRFFERTNSIRLQETKRTPNRVHYSVPNYSKERIVRTIRSNSDLHST